MNVVSVIQSNYIPWKGYFDIINSSDIFIVYDDVQYTRRDWRNRNRIISSGGSFWLTIPVKVKGKYDQKICDVVVDGHHWIEKHTQSLRHAYSKTRYFEIVFDALTESYKAAGHLDRLTDINVLFIRCIMNLLKIETNVTLSSEMEYSGSAASERLLNLCAAVGAGSYLSGPSAKNYLDVEAFSRKGIEVRWMDYAGYPAYRQSGDGFRHDVSIVDLLFNEGPAGARRCMLSFPESTRGNP